MSTERKPGAAGDGATKSSGTLTHAERLLDSLGLLVESGKAKTSADLLRYAQQGGLREGIELLREYAGAGIPANLALDAVRAQARIVAFRRGTGLLTACEGKNVTLVMPLPPHVTGVFSHLATLTYVVPDGHHVPPHLEDDAHGAKVVVGSRAARAIAPSQDVLVFEVVKAGEGYRVDAGVADVVDVRVLPPTTRLFVHLRSQGRPEDVAFDPAGRSLELV